MKAVKLSILFLKRNYKINTLFVVTIGFALSIFLTSVMFKEISFRSVISVLDKSGHMLLVVPSSAVEEIEKTGDVVFTNHFIPEASLPIIANIYDKAIEAGWKRKGGLVSQPGIGEGGKAAEVIQPPTWAPRLYQRVDISGVSVIVAGVDFRKEYEVRLWWDLKEGQWPFDIGEQKVALVGESLKEKLGLKLGDKVNLNGYVFEIYGVLKRIGTEDDNMLFIPIKIAQDIFNKKSLVSLFSVRAMCDFCPVGDALLQINKNTAGIYVLSQQDISKAQYYFRETMYKYLNLVAIITVLSIFIILHLLVGWFISRNAKDIALLKAFGAKVIDIILITCINVGFLTIISSIISYLVSLSITYFMCKVLSSPFLYEFRLSHIFLTIMAGLVIGLGSIILHVLKFSKMSFSKLYNYGRMSYG